MREVRPFRAKQGGSQTCRECFCLRLEYRTRSVDQERRCQRLLVEDELEVLCSKRRHEHNVSGSRVRCSMTKGCLSDESETKLLPGSPWPSLDSSAVSYFLSLSKSQSILYSTSTSIYTCRLPSVSQLLRYPKIAFNAVLQILGVIIRQKTRTVIKTY
jgi:hypothetical protein